MKKTKTVFLSLKQTKNYDKKFIENKIEEIINYFLDNPNEIPELQDIRIGVKVDEEKFLKFKELLKKKNWNIKCFLYQHIR